MIINYNTFNENQLQLDLFNKNKLTADQILVKNNLINKKLNDFLKNGFNNQNLKDNIVYLNNITNYYTEKNNLISNYNIFKIQYSDPYYIFKMYNKPFNKETNLPIFGLQNYIINILRNDISINIPHTTLQITKENEFYIFEFVTVYNAISKNNNEAVYTIEPQPLKSKKQVILNKNKSVDNELESDSDSKEHIDENVNTNFDLNNLNVKLQNKSNTNMMYWDDVYVNDIKIGNVRRQQETINLDTKKIGKQRTYTYYSLTFDRDIIKELFNVNANNSTRNKPDNTLNSIDLKIPFTTKKIKTYLISELTRLYNRD